MYKSYVFIVYLIFVAIIMSGLNLLTEYFLFRLCIDKILLRKYKKKKGLKDAGG